MKNTRTKKQRINDDSTYKYSKRTRKGMKRLESRVISYNQDVHNSNTGGKEFTKPGSIKK